LLLVCAEKLQNPSLLQSFVKNQGSFFYQSDVKSLLNYPPQYGLRAKLSSPKPNHIDDEQIRLSTMKGLWFPILTNLTNLSMDKNLDNQAFSIEILFQVLNKGVDVFDLNFWREILSQVLLPVLEDIDIAFDN
jgi:hypothetical protein